MLRRFVPRVVWTNRMFASRPDGRCLGIRRETINAWERRAPLTPEHVKQLTKAGIRVLIQPSNRRAFPLQDYVTAGAQPQEDLSSAQLILSVKQVPVEELLPGKTYAFFSHTIKAQRDNMELLDTILHRNIRLIDFEKICTPDGRRLVAFGKWAGWAGFIDILHGLGLRLLALGHHTPFLHIALAHNYAEAHSAVSAVRECGYEIALNRLPRSLGPLVFVFTGTGNVAQGACELFEHLPHEFVDVARLPEVVANGEMTKVYGCVVSREDHLMRKEGGRYDEAEFDAHPERYVSKFASEIAPYASVIVNGVYWGPNTPRLLTVGDAKQLFAQGADGRLDSPGCPRLPHRLLAIADISADPHGSIEFMTECTTIDKPFVMYDAHFNSSYESFDAPSGCLVCSIDNMPAQMPLEATNHFGHALLPFIPDMASTPIPHSLTPAADVPFAELKCRPEVKNAIITSEGALTPNFRYIDELRAAQQKAATSKAMAAYTKRVLLLGAGMVSDPLAHYFSQHRRVRLTVASDARVDGARLAMIGDNIESHVLDVGKEPAVLEELVQRHDLVISLLPYLHHPEIARLCIKHGTNMCTSSYVSPELQELQPAARDAGVTIMNEAGLDPGIDHMLAMECIDRVHEQGGRITSFLSFCGGLPAPECSTNALRYKFSWSPKGMLLALMNPARYLRDGRVVDVEGGGGVLDDLHPIGWMPGFSLVGYPNRDSTKYAEIYGVERECRTLIRGTLRYRGFVEAIRALEAAGMLEATKRDFLSPLQGPDLNWRQLLARLHDQPADVPLDALRSAIAARLGPNGADGMAALEELGLLSDRVPERHQTPLDTLVPHLAKTLAYAPGERDLVVLNHDIEAEMPSGHLNRISLVQYGEPHGYSAMARTVGYTTAIVAHMLLQGKWPPAARDIKTPGLLRPTAKEVYRPALQRLQEFGIRATSKLIKQEP
ncbi:Alanine dehydrogenase PNT and Saccharopine dehydrogenase domain containing protein [Aphelenchoides fujianensis]|nr:Alanine dehydrogenase PNT and Saccharopine dehydrogenase domain containing protein [Aphelenchoides fujianensis]